MAGGTGGHVFPALAVAEELRARGVVVNWLGTRRGIEADLVPGADFPLHFIDVVGLRGKSGVIVKLKAPWGLLKALWQAMGVVRRVGPQCVLGFGGFASGPGGLAARLLNKPLVIHEQNAVAGMTNRWLSKVARQTFAAFPKAFAEQVGAVVTGNPVRESLLSIPDKSEIQTPVKLLVIGGSLGAQVFNERLPEAIARLADEIRPEIWHQSGRDKLEATEENYKRMQVTARTQEFIDDMTGAFDWADLVICRAGALTVSELAAAGRASVLVPLPIAVDDHQTANARFLVEADAGILLPQKEMDAEVLATTLESLFSDPEKILAMGKNARRVARPLATEAVVQGCLEKSFG